VVWVNTVWEVKAQWENGITQVIRRKEKVLRWTAKITLVAKWGITLNRIKENETGVKS